MRGRPISKPGTSRSILTFRSFTKGATPQAHQDGVQGRLRVCPEIRQPYGEWLWHDLYGYVWRPYLNDQRFPWGTWQPYIKRQLDKLWRRDVLGLQRAWGWIPTISDSGCGIRKGLVLLPGSMFAPAWVAWEFYSGMYCWRPYSLYDWMYGVDSFWGPCIGTGFMAAV